MSDKSLPVQSTENQIRLLFEPIKIGELVIKNRFVRSATSETMADDNDGATERLIRLHSKLAEGGVGLQVLGHTYVHVTGKYDDKGQTSMCDNSLVPGYKQLTEAVHSRGGRIFAQLTHSGSYCAATGVKVVGPSPVGNPITGRVPKELEGGEIIDIIESFGKASARAKLAGFDGVELHAGHGYLINAFCSPYLNRRNDSWGGSPEKRDRFLVEVYKNVREVVGGQFPVTLKMGVVDMVEEGLTIDESIRRAKLMEGLGVNAITVTCGVRTKQRGSTRPYVAVSGWRALKDLLFHRVFAEPAEEAYFASHAKKIKDALSIPIMLVGGIRSTSTMVEILQKQVADLICMARPFIREPDIVNQIMGGRRGLVDCTSCNICGMHSGKDPLRCWRKHPGWLLYHTVLRASRAVH